MLSAVVKLAQIIIVLEIYNSMPNPKEVAIIKLVGQKIKRYIIIMKSTLIK